MAFFAHQLKQVFRRLARAPLFTTITLITLAVGIGANTVVFSVVEGVLLKPLASPQADRLVGFWHAASWIGFAEHDHASFLFILTLAADSPFYYIFLYDGASAS